MMSQNTWPLSGLPRLPAMTLLGGVLLALSLWWCLPISTRPALRGHSGIELQASSVRAMQLAQVVEAACMSQPDLPDCLNFIRGVIAGLSAASDTNMIQDVAPSPAFQHETDTTHAAHPQQASTAARENHIQPTCSLNRHDAQHADGERKTLKEPACSATQAQSGGPPMQDVNTDVQPHSIQPNTARPHLTGFVLWAHQLILWAFLWAFCIFLYMACGGIDTAPAWLVHQVTRVFCADPALTTTLRMKPSDVVMYKINSWFASSPSAKVIVLLCLTISLIVVGGMALYASSCSHTLAEAFWAAVAGAGIDWAFWEGATDAGRPAARLVSLFISVGGMLVTALLMGIVSDALGSKVDDLRKGRTPVLECQHMLILGWSEKTLCLLDQLCQSAQPEGGSTIVVLSELEKEDMEKEIEKHPFDLRGSTIICRNGAPVSLPDLSKVSIEHARSVVVLANQSDPGQSDAHTLRIALNIMGHSKTNCMNKTNVLVEMCSPESEALLHMLVGGPTLRTLGSREMVGKLIVQIARYPVLAHVMGEVLSFDGNEFYVDATYTSKLVGLPFHTLQSVFHSAVPFGLKHSHGPITLNPPTDMCVSEGDAIILIAEDSSPEALAPVFPMQPEIAAAAAAKLLNAKPLPSFFQVVQQSVGTHTVAKWWLSKPTLPCVSDTATQSTRLLADPVLGADTFDKSGTGVVVGQEARCAAPQVVGQHNDIKLSFPPRPWSGQGMDTAMRPSVPRRPQSTDMGSGLNPRTSSRLSPCPSQYLEASDATNTLPHGSQAGPPIEHSSPWVQTAALQVRQTSLTRRGPLCDTQVRDSSGSGRAPLSRQASFSRLNTTHMQHEPWSAQQNASHPNTSHGEEKQKGGKWGLAGPHQTSTIGSNGMSFGGRFLFIGWRSDIAQLCKTLDDFVTTPSEVWLFSDKAFEERALLLAQSGLDMSEPDCGLTKVKLMWQGPHLLGSPLVKSQLQALYPLQFTSILVLGQEVGSGSGARTISDIDSRTVTTLLLTRQIQLEDFRSKRHPPDAPPGFSYICSKPGKGAARRDSAVSKSRQYTSYRIPPVHGDAPSFAGGPIHAGPPFTEPLRSQSAEHHLCLKDLQQLEVASRQSGGTNSLFGTAAGQEACLAPHVKEDDQDTPPPDVGGEAVVQAEETVESLDCKGAEVKVETGVDSKGGPFGTAPDPGLLLDQSTSLLGLGRVPLIVISTLTSGNALVSSQDARHAAASGVGSELSMPELLQSYGHKSSVTDQLSNACVGSVTDENAQPKVEESTQSTSLIQLHPTAGPQPLLERVSEPCSWSAVVSLKGGSQQAVAGSGKTEDLSAAVKQRDIQPELVPGTHPRSSASGVALPGAVGLLHSDSARGWVPRCHSGNSRGSEVFRLLENASNDEGSDSGSSDKSSDHGPYKPSLSSVVSFTGAADNSTPPCMPVSANQSLQRDCAERTADAALAAVGDYAPEVEAPLLPPPLQPTDSLCFPVRLQGPTQSPVRTTGKAGVKGWGALRASAASKQASSSAADTAPATGSVAVEGAGGGAGGFDPAIKTKLLGMLGVSSAISRMAGLVRDRSKLATPPVTAASGQKPEPETGGGGLLSAMQGLTPGGVDNSVAAKRGRRARRALALAKQKSCWTTDLAEVVRKTTIVCELLDQKTYSLVKDLKCAQYVMTNEIVSQLLALVATCPDRADIFAELFAPGGNEMMTRPGNWLMSKDEKCSFLQLASRAQMKGEVLLGYRERGTGRTILNPPQKHTVCLSRALCEAVITIAWGCS